MARVALRPPSLRRRYFSASAVLRHGLLTKKQLRSKAWRRLFRGIYADSSMADTHLLRCFAAARYLIPDGGALAGRSAATILGCGLAEVVDPVEVLVPPQAATPSMRGLTVHRGPLPSEDVCRFGTVTITTPVRTCWDLASWLDVVEAVVLIDRMLRARRVGLRQLQAYAALRAGQRGSGRFGTALAL